MTVNPKMLIECQNPVAHALLDHRHQAGIGQRHGEVTVFFHEGEDTLRVGLKMIHDLDPPLPHPGTDLVDGTRKRSQQKTRFRQNRLTGEKRRAQAREGFPHPRMRALPAIKIRNQRPGIEHHALPHRPKPSMCFGLVAKSPIPLSTHPQPSFIKSYAVGSSSTAHSALNSRSKDSRINADFDTPKRFARFAKCTASSSGSFTVIVFINGKVLPFATLRNTPLRKFPTYTARRAVPLDIDLITATLINMLQKSFISPDTVAPTTSLGAPLKQQRSRHLQSERAIHPRPRRGRGPFEKSSLVTRIFEERGIDKAEVTQ